MTYPCRKCTVQRVSRWQHSNRDRVNSSARKRRRIFPDRVRSYYRKRYYDNIVREREARLDYYHRTKECRKDRIRESRARSRKKLYVKFHGQIRLIASLRNRIRKMFRRSGSQKIGSTVELLGCSIADFRIYIESRFQPGMTRDNYGSVWNLDHIIPCALFDLTKPDHQKICFHFSNYQPLFKEQNMKKSDFLDDGRRARHVRTEAL